MTECCPLCGSPDPRFFHRDRRREYLRCDNCELAFVSPKDYVSSAEELAYYQQHENQPDDPGYRRFLSRLADPLCERLAAQSVGMDFGCGPGPALAAMLTEAGHCMSLYDHFFFDDPAVLQGSYDFITATEVVEHLHRPGDVLERLWRLLLPGGYLAVMTKLVQSQEAFARWHYIRDPTHVCFFSRQTWTWWADCHHARVDFVGADVILLQKDLGSAEAKVPV
ncbi:class I SAM-dependent methyltransferase [Congregibacter variabilis]|uniref:Class I SAM-dependent methyltransferase n=1 Tax=Congregibacter variabilis TaxID=3081200 RepID=A0ABZ0I0D4_9GAMM|nr:class I SAM-dependent methyltransferase [Congregibacter sp. IMCC43200]